MPKQKTTTEAAHHTAVPVHVKLHFPPLSEDSYVSLQLLIQP